MEERQYITGGQMLHEKVRGSQERWFCSIGRWLWGDGDKRRLANKEGSWLRNQETIWDTGDERGKRARCTGRVMGREKESRERR
jgi:hypothetical protein